MQKTLFEASKYKLIYVFRINDKAHKGALKIGEATIGENISVKEVLELQPNAKILNKYAKVRINQYTQTAGVAFELLYTETAVYEKDGKIYGFSDTNVHDVLRRSGIIQKKFKGDTGQGTEWYITDLETAKNGIKAKKEGRSSLYGHEVTTGQSPIIFRPEQREAIDCTKKQFKKGGKQMLWNAKMRFGKTLSALQVIKEMEVKRTLIYTHRPDVEKGWYQDFLKIFYDKEGKYIFGSRNKGEVFSNLDKVRGEDGHIIYFASLQDLRGSEIVGGKFNKNDEIFTTTWDLIIVDEAHEGTLTDHGKAVLAELLGDETKVLRLSGTPFNLLDDFKDDEIYTWDYVMEQRAKRDWDLTHFGDPNPYTVLPAMHIYTYDLGRLMNEFIDEEVAFNFREFFRVNDDGEFIHKKDVSAFLNLLVKDDKENGSCYPFANDTFRDIFRHTLWTVPGVQAAKALSKMLQEHKVFQHFHIVNVAGEGDEEVERKKALEKVEKAIGDNPDETYTITLTCGRLTTGVTVPAWTGCLMLSGSYSTAASSYMQTIFRVQSPATYNGHTKEDCYVFDFAPDRTLQVLATVPRVSTKAGKTTEGQKRLLAELLNFCSVISIEGGEMTANKMTPEKMLQHLKRAYIEKVVQSGFENTYLYNDELLKLSDIEIKEFENLGNIIGETKALGKVGNIVINDQGLTEEQYAEMQVLEKKKKKKAVLTEEEKKRLEDLKKSKTGRDKAVSVLRSISIRMPLLIYGAEIKDENKELTIDNFAQLVDEQSWKVFMPKGITKEEFEKFKKYYDPEIFSGAGKHIRSLARSADKMPIEERIERITGIFATLRNPDKETVLTPWQTVNRHMGDTLGGYCFYEEGYNEAIIDPRYIDHGAITDDVYAPDSHLLEINSKTGLYPLYLAYNVYRRRLKDLTTSPQTLEEHLKVWDKVVAENIFVICMSPMAKSITRRTLVGFRNAKVNTRYFEDLVNQLKEKQKRNTFLQKVVDGKKYWKANNNDNMKFNAIVGNPPYQEEGISTRKSPVYHLFYDAAFSLSDRVTLITLGRFLFKAGQTPEAWMDKMLKDKHLKVVSYFKNSTDVFPFVEIKGGVVITLRDANKDFGAIGFFSEYDELISILQKVSSHKDFKKGDFTNIVSSRGQYKFSNLLFEKFPYVKDVQGKGTGSQIASNSLDNLPKIFLNDKPEDGEAYIQIFGRENNNRVIRWIRRDYVQPIDTLDCYKVFIPEANGTGALGEVLSSPVIGKPIIGHTDTFLSIGKFKTLFEGEACLKYVKTKFARTMLGTLKGTQHNPRDSWANVPLQDFTDKSDIDWSQSVADIDQQLYKKYGLTEKEQQFIEKMIRPM